MLVLVRIHKLIIASALALPFSFAAQAIVGQPGTLDPFWATGSPLGAGKVITPMGNGANSAASMALQPDGKVVVVGQCMGTINIDFCALRYSRDGTLDASFGIGGKVITAVSSRNDYAASVALQADGKIVLAGQCRYNNASQGNFCAIRYKSDGTLDATFGVAGVVITPIGEDDYARAISLQLDGKIVLAGACTLAGNSNSNFCALRYKADGTLDTTFGNAGTVITPGEIGNAAAVAIALQPDGKILLAGQCSNAPNYYFCGLRYDAAGVLDSSFGNGGRLLGDVSKVFSNALALQPDGKLLLAGGCDVGGGTGYDFCALRYNSNGTLDAGFGVGGSVVMAVNSGNVRDSANAVLLQPDGKILLAGSCDVGSLGNFCVLRFHSNGLLDTSFGSGGKTLTALGDQSNSATAMALQPDGKLILAGSCAATSGGGFCAARYDGGPFGYQNCKLDIDGDGLVLATTDMLIGTRIALGITGNAVIGGITFSSNATRNTWPLIRDYLVTQCGLSLVQ